MKQDVEQSNQLNLTVVALVALVAIVGLVALVMNMATGTAAATPGPQVMGVDDENLAGDASEIPKRRIRKYADSNRIFDSQN